MHTLRCVLSSSDSQLSQPASPGRQLTMARGSCCSAASSASSGTSMESNTMSQPWYTLRLFSSRPAGGTGAVRGGEKQLRSCERGS